MAEHKKLDAVKDLPPHVNHEPHRIATAEGTNIPFSKGGSKQHDTTDQHKHLQSRTGEKGASVSQELIELANKEHDSESHFSSDSSKQNPFKGKK